MAPRCWRDRLIAASHASGARQDSLQDWNSLRKIDITNSEILSTVEERNLEFEEPYDRGWISQIYGAGTSGDSVFCSVGLERKTGRQSSKVDYYLAQLSMMNGEYEIITKLTDGHL